MSDLPDDFDLDALLAPIPGDAPSGPDLREDYAPQAPYYRLRDARADARAAEREADKGNSDDTSTPKEWRTIRELGTRTVAQAAKDLEIAAWLSEALLRTDGLPGLAAGFRLMAGLVEVFWDTLHPMPDEDGTATRVAPITGLNGSGGDGTLMQPLRKLVVYVRPDGAPLALWQYDEAVKVHGSGAATRRAARRAAGVLPYDTVENEARAAGAARFQALRRAARAAADAWAALTTAVDARAGADGPQTSQVRDLLAHIIEIADRYAPPEDVAIAEDTAADQQIVTSPNGLATGPAITSGRAATREDALRALGELAEFFRRTEPHSPLAYTLQEAIRRGRMSWPELLAEIVPDASSRSAILTSLGIRPPPEE
jgi:type VI secretion system protein ImpA